MLDRLFEKPVEKLQEFLKWIFLFITGSEFMLICIVYGSKINAQLSYYHDIEVIGQSIIIGLIAMILTFTINYAICLFMYMVISYFQDIHEIKNSLVDKKKIQLNKPETQEKDGQ